MMRELMLMLMLFSGFSYSSSYYEPECDEKCEFSCVNMLNDFQSEMSVFKYTLKELKKDCDDGNDDIDDLKEFNSEIRIKIDYYEGLKERYLGQLDTVLNIVWGVVTVVAAFAIFSGVYIFIDVRNLKKKQQEAIRQQDEHLERMREIRDDASSSLRARLEVYDRCIRIFYLTAGEGDLDQEELYTNLSQVSQNVGAGDQIFSFVIDILEKNRGRLDDENAELLERVRNELDM